jgi:hypothetical protein
MTMSSPVNEVTRSSSLGQLTYAAEQVRAQETRLGVGGESLHRNTGRAARALEQQ